MELRIDFIRLHTSSSWTTSAIAAKLKQNNSYPAFLEYMLRSKLPDLGKGKNQISASWGESIKSKVTSSGMPYWGFCFPSTGYFNMCSLHLTMWVDWMVVITYQNKRIFVMFSGLIWGINTFTPNLYRHLGLASHAETQLLGHMLSWWPSPTILQAADPFRVYGMQVWNLDSSHIFEDACCVSIVRSNTS